jgi:hypothetical protein
MSLAGCNHLNKMKADSDASGNNPGNEVYLKAKCEKKCEEHFRKEYGNGRLNDGRRMVSYQSHYNRKLNKCFIMVDTTFNVEKHKLSYREKFLFDVNYLRDYAFYHDSGKITFCDVERNKCGSEAEWISLVKPYMEE